ncbi:hypothetical protein BGX38DRAFT_1273500 [Terfezia claveryi]|nr:hypothetical protein BGX38DRAFT_1273500 [Terfezia claveryi]
MRRGGDNEEALDEGEGTDDSNETAARYADGRGHRGMAWDGAWEEKFGEVKPIWPAEEFLRELAVFAEKHTKWDAAKALMKKG